MTTTAIQNRIISIAVDDLDRIAIDEDEVGETLERARAVITKVEGAA